MINISGFLQKFLNFEKDKNTKLLLVLGAIKKQTGLELSNKDLEIRGDNLILKTNPIFRNEIFMHKAAVEDDLRNQKVFLKLI